MARAVTDPVAWKAAGHPWQIFATLTWSNELVNASSVRKMKLFYAHLRLVARRLPVCGKRGRVHSNRQSFKALEFLGRGEHGETTGRHHLHYLLASLEPSCLNVSTMFFIKNSWEKLTGSHARVWRFDPSLPGAEYVLKPHPTGFDRNAAASYELGKFVGDDGARELMLAQSLIQRWVMAQSDKRARKPLAATVRSCQDRSRDLAGKETQGTGLVGSYTLNSAR